MGAVGWIVVIVAAAAGLVIAGLRQRSGRKSADVDVGSVSEGWLSEQRARKDS
jgi:hypothetical protein